MTTRHEYRGYVFSITYQPQHPAYTVDYPDFPDIITSGDTLAEAFAHACEALDLHLESMAKLKMRPPKPIAERVHAKAAGTYSVTILEFRRGQSVIPKTITRQCILDAIAEIERNGIPLGRASRKFSVEYNGRQYPAKYLVSLAHRIATGGTELPSSAFNGGRETNRFLKSLGFKISGAKKPGGGAPRTESKVTRRMRVKTQRARPITPLSRVGKPRHNGERCEDCKRVVKELLQANYGHVEQNHQLAGGARPKDYANATCYKTLLDIFEALEQHRGRDDFVRAKALSRSDFFVRDPGFLVEFDESQHFTELRHVALRHYPSDLSFGFDLREWMTRCRKLHKTDNDPPFRDEQRAWYDTLRDFAPHVRGMLPTLRLYAGEFKWCRLDPANPMDVDTFRQILGERADFWRIDFHIPINAPLARIVIDGSWRGDCRLAKKLLRDVCDGWPSNAHVHCLSTCGAFIVFDWPEAIPTQADNRFPSAEAMQALHKTAREQLNAVLEDDLLKRLRKVSDFLTVGVDSRKSKISGTDNWLSENHAELVYVVDLKTGEIIGVTGKSYPTPKQARSLFRVEDIDSHFVTLGGVRAMVLGCHDLTIFNPRSDAKVSAEWRMQTKSAFKRRAKGWRPAWVLQHPHTTVSPMTWRHAWSALTNKQEYPSIESYLGTGCYSYRDSRNGLNRKPLQSVLDKTKSPDVADIVVHLGMAEPTREAI